LGKVACHLVLLVKQIKMSTKVVNIFVLVLVKINCNKVKLDLLVKIELFQAVIQEEETTKGLIQYKVFSIMSVQTNHQIRQSINLLVVICTITTILMFLLQIILSNNQLLVVKRLNKLNQIRAQNLLAIINKNNQLEEMEVIKTRMLNKILH
jgi:hypothetical protein